VFADRIKRVAEEFADDPSVEKIIAFVRAGGKRPLMHPRVKRQAEDNEGDAS
jgi:hypothetical protein